MAGQRQLDENAVDRWIGVQALDKPEEFFFAGLFGKLVLDRVEAALFGHAAFRSDIDLAGRILADDHDRKAGLDARLFPEDVRGRLDLLDNVGRNCLAVYPLCHELLPTSSLRRDNCMTSLPMESFQRRQMTELEQPVI